MNNKNVSGFTATLCIGGALVAAYWFLFGAPTTILHWLPNNNGSIVVMDSDRDRIVREAKSNFIVINCGSLGFGTSEYQKCADKIASTSAYQSIELP